MQGKWKATVGGDEGSSTWTLTVTSNKATLVIESKAGDVVFKGELDFKLEKHGSFKAFTYWNLKNTTRDRDREPGLTDGNTKSSIYKLSGDAFTSVGGFREDDDDKQVLIQWERVPEARK